MANKAAIINANISTRHKVMGLVVCIAQEQKMEITRRISPFGLSILQLSVLHALEKAPEQKLTVNQLKSAMVDESPNVSRSLNKLVDSGYVEKIRSQEDQRVVHIHLTSKGQNAHRDADAALMSADSADISSALNDQEVEQLFQLLSRL